jgi:hypothetical protein
MILIFIKCNGVEMWNKIITFLSYLELIRADASFVPIQEAATDVLVKCEKANQVIQGALFEIVVEKVCEHEVPALASGHQFTVLRLGNRNISFFGFQEK